MTAANRQKNLYNDSSKQTRTKDKSKPDSKPKLHMFIDHNNSKPPKKPRYFFFGKSPQILGKLYSQQSGPYARHYHKRHR
ncbi:hypothetical protein CCACVL1_27312 [Corchorus capsularis]|uniref:Uncharacterized protein n=1 Tax=Corchorus capsularis TaxID=210143 RepID=A0A1R3GB47_COCAP|nr:hypothetical protein CCACVL1_27312 [Corchorus capsularis]